ncbi:hypothetical protein CU098_011734 [Rhizopus stolonifer]|uniref:Kinetochore protein SPC25 n=1 Tax=Rhizopus stolonifer TaxID=4846 RepID=A0A367KHJ7_RHIST|nr:hypothetical protein CU098_011734 [Rhizopus stolonifer]
MSEINKPTIEELETMSSRFIESVTRQLNEIRQNSSKNVKNFEKNREAFLKKEKELKDEIEKTKANITNNEQMLRDTEDLSILQRLEQLKQQYEDRETQLKKKTAKRDQLKETFMEKKMEIEYRINESEGRSKKALRELEACMFYTQLQIMPLPDESIKFIYLKISQKLPEKEYSFVLHISETRVYSVRDCTPDMPFMSNQIVELNATRDLYMFLITTRFHLQKMANN